MSQLSREPTRLQDRSSGDLNPLVIPELYTWYLDAEGLPDQRNAVRDLTNNVVAITGASAGIGAATAKALLEQGASVVVGARRVARLDQLAASAPERVAVVDMDVRNPDDSQRLVAAAYDTFGRLDALVANAGIGAYGGILDLTDDQLAVMMDTNIAGTVWPIRAAVPGFIDAGAGDIVIVASVAGIRGAGDEAVYAATKFAQVGLAGGLDQGAAGQGHPRLHLGTRRNGDRVRHGCGPYA